MNMKLAIFCSFFGLTFLLSAQTIAVNGVDRDGYGGIYEIGGQNYWWMCVEPNSSTSAGSGDGFLADALSLTSAWSSQNTERQTFYNNNPGYLTTVIPKQVAVMEYVLDTYLAWTSPQDANSANYGTNTTFNNAFFTIQNFLAETYGNVTKSDFTDMSDFTFIEGNAVGNVAAIAARQALFQSILNDVAAKDSASFFDTYVATNTYYIANTLFSETSLDNWQDALVITSIVAVPEPSGALLISFTGLAIILRRFRRVTV